MKHIMVNDRVYLVSDEIYGKIVAAFTLANTTDGDMSNIIDTVEKYGKLVGTVYLVFPRKIALLNRPTKCWYGVFLMEL